MRPYTRASLSNMLDQAGARIQDADPGPATDQAEEIYEALTHELRFDMQGPCLVHQGNTRVESVYTVARAISGTPLRDSYHLGSTVINDYGRPYANGFNNYTGASGYASAGRFLIYARGEFEGAPSAAGYSDGAGAADLLEPGGRQFPLNPATGLPFMQSTIPMGPIASHHERASSRRRTSPRIISTTKSPSARPTTGWGRAWAPAWPTPTTPKTSTAFRINRIEPLHVPGLSYITGPFRYEFLIGPLRGHTYIPYLGPPTGLHPNVINPGDPWMHLEKISFRPTENLEFGFERTVIWGGQGHGPITLHTFLKSFFSFSSPSAAVKDGTQRSGRALWRIRRSPTAFPSCASGSPSTSTPRPTTKSLQSTRRAAPRTGPASISRTCPALPELDMRVEGANTDSSTSDSQGRPFPVL